MAQMLGTSLPAGAADTEITGIASPAGAKESEITFLSQKGYRAAVEASSCAAVIVRRGEAVAGKTCLETDDPYVGYARIAQVFEDRRPLWNEGVAATATIDKSAKIGPGTSVGPQTVIGGGVTVGSSCSIGAHCVIERGVRIGDSCRIDSGVVVRWNSVIGSRCIIQSCTVVGSDGFGNAREKGAFIRIPCFGNVVIEDDVEIGAGSMVDRGNFESTVIRRGARIDNLVHVAHNVAIGQDTAIAAQTGISGSTRIGNRVLIGGQAGFVGHLEIGDDSFVGAKAGVSKDIKPGEQVTGYPARDIMTLRRIEAAQGSLPEMRRELKRLRAEIEELKKRKGSL
jgi:UDP-3-O-[3-hydroxymyristoyl] glucosamine N-acyltransferase